MSGSGAAGGGSLDGADQEPEEISLQLTVSGVSRLDDVAFSKIARLKGHQWRLMVVRREVNNKDIMGAYVQHVGNKSSAQWGIVISATITLVNQSDPEKSFSKDFKHRYSNSSTDWGYSSFLRWKDVVSIHRGFVKDDAIFVRARLAYPGPDANPDPTPSSSQSHSALSSQSHTSTTSSLLRTSSSSLSSTTSSPSSSRLAQTTTHPASSSSLSQLASQDSGPENFELTPSSTSVLPPEMVSFLTCPRCNEQYEAEGQRSPNTLHCGHSFCLSCLEKMISVSKQQHLVCPTCSREHPTDGPSKPWFPNISVSQLVKSVQAKTKHFCPTHQHDRNYFCLRDRVLVCIYCAYHGEHSGHPCRPVNEARVAVRDELRPLRVRAQGRVTEAERRLELMRDEMEGARTQTQSCVRMVEDYFTSLETALQRQKHLLLKDLDTQTDIIQSSLMDQITELERHHSKAKKCLSDYEKWKTMPAREALGSISTISSSLQSTASNPLPSQERQQTTPSGGTAGIHVHLPPSDALSSLGSLGHVTVTCSQGTTRVEEDGGKTIKDNLPAEGGLSLTQDTVQLMDTQEEVEGEAPANQGLVKRSRESSNEFEVHSKRRKS